MLLPLAVQAQVPAPGAEHPRVAHTAWQQDGGAYGRRDYHGVLAPEWQQKFDSYYQRWLKYRASNDQDDVRSMEGRMRDIMSHYQIPPDVPFAAVASPNISGNYPGQYGYPGNAYPGNGGYYGNQGYGGRDLHHVLAPEWQQKFDSYYQRWLTYRQTNNESEARSMEGRMRDIMNHYQIPPDVPFGAVASEGIGGNQGYYGRGDNDEDDYGRGAYGQYGRARLSPEDQAKFDSYYRKWVDATRKNDRDDIEGNAKHMRDIMARYGIPPNVPFGAIASGGARPQRY